jgi:hypothetical protein
MTGSQLIPLDQLGAEIMARIEAGDKAKTKADNHYLAAGLQLIKAREQAGRSFDGFLRKHCRGLKRSRAYQLMSIAGGKTTVEAERTKTAERMRKHRAAAKCPSRDGQLDHPLRNGRGSGGTTQIQKKSPEWLLSETRFFIDMWFPKMDAPTLAKAKALIAAWQPASLKEAA